MPLPVFTVRPEESRCRRRKPDCDPRPLTRHRSDDHLPTGRVHAFMHAQQTETHVMVRAAGESLSTIRDMEMDVSPSLGQVHNRRSRAAVFDDVLQRLLRDAEQTEGCVGRHTWADYTPPELDSYAGATRHVIAEARDGLREPEKFKPWWVEVKRQTVDVADDVSDLLGETGNGLGERCGHQTSMRAEAFDLDAQQRKLLADVVVQFARDVTAF